MSSEIPRTPEREEPFAPVYDGENPYASPNLNSPPQTDFDANVRMAGDGRPQPYGLGGWLILVGIGLVISPFSIFALFVSTFVPIFTDGTWQALTTPGSPNYAAFWAPLIIFESVANLTFIVAYSVLIVLFFQKSRRFRTSYIVVRLANLGFIVVDTLICMQVLPMEQATSPEAVRDLVSMFVGTAIWVPYIYYSQRARNTFVH